MGLQALTKARPEAVGIEPQGIVNFVEQIQELNINLHSFMLLRHGHVVAEGYAKPFNAKLLHPVFSVSKSFTSAAVGIAVGEGLFKLDDRIIDFFPEKLTDPVHPYTAAMKVKHLLSMQTVHRASTNTDTDDWVQAFLHTPPSHPPGTVFAYDTTATHTLCAIIQRTSGQTVQDYLRPRLFDPIGIGPIEWETCPMGINKGGSGIRCTTGDLARFGQLYLQNGEWNGRRILPEGWVEQSTKKVVDNSNAKALLDGRQGYGFQFWRSRNHSYCAFGMGGQFILVVPDQRIVFVTTANTLQNRDEHQLILDSFWSCIYPAVSEETVTEDDEAFALLQQRLDEWQLQLPNGSSNGKPASDSTSRRYKLTDNRLGFEACEFVWGDEPRLIFYAKHQPKAACSISMKRPRIESDPFLNLDAASTSVWVDEHTLIIQIQLLDDLQMFILTCRFTEDWLVIQIKPVGVLKTGQLDAELIGLAE